MTQAGSNQENGMDPHEDAPGSGGDDQPSAEETEKLTAEVNERNIICGKMKEGQELAEELFGADPPAGGPACEEAAADDDDADAARCHTKNRSNSYEDAPADDDADADRCHTRNRSDSYEDAPADDGVSEGYGDSRRARLDEQDRSLGGRLE